MQFCLAGLNLFTQDESLVFAFVKAILNLVHDKGPSSPRVLLCPLIMFVRCRHCGISIGAADREGHAERVGQSGHEG